MNFIAQVEEHLRDLGTEARKKHPGVKEASERAILQLRTLQNAYSTAVRKATQTGGPHPTTALFRSQDLLRPFLLATNYPNASPKLLDISFRAMRLLIEGNAICPGDGIHMVRVWTIQANVCASQHSSASSSHHHHHNFPSSSVGTSTTASSSSSSSWFGGFALSGDGGVSSSTGHSGTGPVGPKKEHDRLAMEILDCLIMLLELRDLEVTEEQWSSSVALCCILLDISDNKKGGSTTLPHAARQTLRQVILLLYERSGDDPVAENTWTDLLHLASEPNKRESLTGAFSHCTTIVSHKMGPVPPPPCLCLDLLHLVLVQRPELFGRNDSLGEMVPSTAIVLIELLRSTSASFGILWRTLRLARDMILCQNQEWTSVCHELLLELVYGISTATEACRNNHDFEDGYIYTLAAPAASSSEPLDHTRRRSSTRVPLTTPLVSERLLWKAALVLEILHKVLTDQPHVVLEKDGTLVAVVSEAVSDFATIAASCRDNMLQVVECAKDSNLVNPDAPIKPTIFQRAEDIGSINVGAPGESGRGSPIRKPGASGDSAAPQPAPFPPSDVGEPVWVAFHCILLLSRSLRKLCKEEISDVDDDRIRALMDGSFAPSLAVLQHYLKRFPGSNVITKCTLGGYANLADVAVPVSHGTELQRKALLSSLCKLSLPSWGKLGSTCQLQDHHVSALVCLLEIMHKNYDSILSEWYTVLRTLEELSTLSIASPKLSDDGYKAALAVSEAYARIAPLTGCLFPDSLTFLIDALADISIASIEDRNWLSEGDHAGVVPTEQHPQASRPDDNGADTKAERRIPLNRTGIDEGNPKESISGKLMSFAGRAISAGLGTASTGDGSSSEHQTETSETVIPPDQRTRKTYYEDYRHTFAKRMLESNRTTSNNIFRQLPFSLAALTDVAMSNSFRFESCGTSILRHLCALAASSSDIRPYAMDTLVMLVTSQLSSDDSSMPASSAGPQMIVEEALSQGFYLAVKDAQVASANNQNETQSEEHFGDEPQTMPHDVLLTPLCNAIRSAEQEDVAEAGIGALRSILEGAGHNITEEAWLVVIDAVSSLSGDTSIRRGGIILSNRSAAEWSTCCMLAFRCLKLIVDDFLDQLPHRTVTSSVGARTALLDCCSTFGSSRHDVNTSLTAIGLLWTIADQDPDPNSIDHALSKLVFLSADNRTEVRNCSVNTLFSCLVGRGQRFSASQWQAIVFQTVFAVFDRISSRGEEDAENHVTDAYPDGESSSAQPKSRYEVKIHHSRDSVGKQWAATEVIALNGLSRVLRNFFSQLLATMDGGDDPNEELDRNRENPWFETAWKRILVYALNSSTQVGGRETLELRKEGVDLLILCTRLSCRAGIVAATTPARVGTNMEVVNGALRSVRGANSKTMEKESQSSISELQSRWRHQLFLDSFRALEEFRRHLEDDVADDESSSSYGETAQLQVLHQLSIGLGTLYECCKDEELSSSSEDDLERRFVELVTTVAKKAVGEPGARFLTQAQRASFDLLRCMTSNRSSEALKNIASLAGPSFFWVIRDDREENGASKRGVELLSHEAAKVVADEISKESLPHESKVELLCRILSVHVTEGDNKSRNVDRQEEKTRCYDLLVPVMKVGLQSAASLGDYALDSSSSGEESDSAVEGSTASVKVEKEQLLDFLWDRMFRVLSHMLSPVYAAPHSLRIPSTSNILDILACVLEFAAPPQYDELCIVFSSGATNSLDVLKAQNSSEGKAADLAEIKIFQACFSGLCKLQPEGGALRSVTESALKDALSFIETNGGVLGNKTDLGAEISLVVCESIQGFPHLDSLVLAVFPLLLKLTAVDHTGLRKELAAVLGHIDLGQVLEDARQKYERAEERAKVAERRNVELTAVIEELRDENESLNQQVLVFSASSALS